MEIPSTELIGLALAAWNGLLHRRMFRLNFQLKLLSADGDEVQAPPTARALPPQPPPPLPIEAEQLTRLEASFGELHIRLSAIENTLRAIQAAPPDDLASKDWDDLVR